MTRAMHSELIKLWRRRTVILAVVITVTYAVATTALITVSVGPDGLGGGFGPTPDSLGAPGGGTELLATALSFAGFFVLVLFTGAVAAEFSRGTVRTMVLRQPDRVALLAGKLAAMLVSAAVILAGATVVGWLTARLVAPTQGIAVDRWASLDGLGAGLFDYGTVLFWVTGYALLGTALAVVVRSVPIALAIGIAWAGPFEHILADAWSAAGAIFPGLLLEAVVAGGTPDVSAGRAFATSLGYAALAATVAGLAFTRRDVA